MATLKGGYDFDFVEPPPKRLECTICLLVVRDPHVISCCGNHFCRPCLERVQRDKKPCPLCNASDYTAFFHKGVTREVNDLHVHCPQKELGCYWEGELGELERHLEDAGGKGCGFVEVECAYKCGRRFLRSAIGEHESKACASRPVEVVMAEILKKLDELSAENHAIKEENRQLKNEVTATRAQVKGSIVGLSRRTDELDAKFLQLQSSLPTEAGFTELQDYSLAAEAEITQLKDTLATKAEVIQLKNSLATKAEVTHLKSSLATKAEVTHLKSSLATKTEVTRLNSSLATKAEVTQLFSCLATKADVTHLKSSLATEAEVAHIYSCLATKTEVSHLKSSLATKAEVAHLKSSLATKGEVAHVYNCLATKAEVAHLKSSLATKGEVAHVYNCLATKAEVTQLKSSLATKGEVTQLKSSLATKAEVTHLKSTLATKADVTQLKSSLATKGAPHASTPHLFSLPPAPPVVHVEGPRGGHRGRGHHRGGSHERGQRGGRGKSHH